VEQEKHMVVALLMLQAVQEVPAALLVEQASQALSNPCPAVRYLAARLLGRSKKRPIEILKETIAREPNPALKDQLVDLLQYGRRLPAARHALRLWLQL
jgi:hypothetical protein